MMIVQVAGSPFDDRTLLILEAEDGTLQHVYVSNAVVDWIGTDADTARPIYSDETATLVVEDRPLADTWERNRACGAWSDRTVVLHQE